MMRKFVYLITLLLLLGGGSLAAQELRTVRGMVATPDGQVIPNATLKADGVDTPFKANRVGQFEIKIPFACQKLTVYVDGYTPLTMDVAGSFLLFKMKPVSQDNAAQAKSDDEKALAEAKAAREAKEKAEAEAAAKAKAEAEARAQAEKEAAERASAAAAATSASATAAATTATTTTATEQAPQAQASQQAQAPQQPKAQSTQSKYKNSGLMQSIDFSYAYQFGKGQIVYTNSGIRAYSALHPLQLTYSIGWRFNKMFSLMAGAGFQYNLISLERKGDTPDAELYPDDKFKGFDVPVLLDFRVHFLEGPVQPYIRLCGGIYALSVSPLADLGIGASFRLGGSLALNLAVSARTTAWPHYSQSGFNGYPFHIAPAITAGFIF